MFAIMRATAFDSHARAGIRRQVVRRVDDAIELVELRWGLDPGDPAAAPWRFVRSEGRSFPSGRCLVPASSFDVRRGDKRFRVTLATGDWFYLSGVWRPATRRWPASFAVLTVEANEEVARHQGRQGAVILRGRHMDWLDLAVPGAELLRPLPPGSFVVDRLAGDDAQATLAI